MNITPDPVTYRDTYRRLIRTPRQGLRESLEAYSKRVGLHYDVARPYWRSEGLRLLNAAPAFRAAFPLVLVARCAIGLCAVAPGVVVETKEQILEREEEIQC